MKPLVSVIVPVYNEEKTLRSVVDTVLKSQVAIQVICVNDGSTDKSLEILKSFENKIILINFKKNKGKGAALAAGIRRARGKIVVFIDSDLVGLKTFHLKKIVNTLIDEKLDAVLVDIDVPKIIYKILSSSMLNYYNIEHDPITGERAYYKKDLLPHVKTIKKLGYGVEMRLNTLYKDRKIGFIRLFGVTQPLKHQKWGFRRETLKKYFNESKDILIEYGKQKILEKINRMNQILFFKL